MRVYRTSGGLRVRVISGTYVVLIAMHMDQAACAGHMGFAIHRTDHTDETAGWLEGTKTFAQTDPGFPPGAKYPTNQHPIQGFTWSDFTAKPGHRYTYRVQALRGTPAALVKFRQVDVPITTESDEGGDHDVYFNRGAAASQEFAARFNPKPGLDAAPDNDPRWAWLSRGANEALGAFVGRATDASFAIRVCAYEFRLPSFAQSLKAAHDRGVDVRVLYDGNANPPEANGSVFPRDANRKTALDAGIASLCTERITRPDVKSPPISHHKFIVLLKDGEPLAVLTGSTNFSRGGVFGQSNVVHVVDDAKVAGKYLACWTLLATNPPHAALKGELALLNPSLATLPKKGTSCIFSPQPDDATLAWYAKLATEAPDALFMAFAFGMGAPFKAAYLAGVAPLRYALMDKLLPPGVRKEKKEEATAEMTRIRKKLANRIAVGNRIATNAFDRWLSERLTGLNEHVQFIHTKFMLLNPLGNDPVVITGSANFSEASTDSNDENMLVIRGNKRVADIYLGEYMRLWNHYAFREWLAAGAPGADPEFKNLDTQDQWWRRYFGSTARSRQRAYFAGVPFDV